MSSCSWKPPLSPKAFCFFWLDSSYLTLILCYMTFWVPISRSDPKDIVSVSPSSSRSIHPLRILFIRLQYCFYFIQLMFFHLFSSLTFSSLFSNLFCNDSISSAESVSSLACLDYWWDLTYSSSLSMSSLFSLSKTSKLLWTSLSFTLSCSTLSNNS